MEIKLSQAQERIAKCKNRFRVVNCGRRFGKALAIDTPILTRDGYKSLIDIKVGDYVYDENGESVEVLYKSEIYKDRECYAISFSDGEVIKADKNHDWIVEDKSYRKNLVRSNNVKKIKKTTYELTKNLKYDEKENNYSIELAKSIKHNEKKLPIEPYFLGIWLGDGSSANCGITTIDNEVIEYLGEYAKNSGTKLRKGGTGSASTYFITGNRTQKSRDNSLQSRLRLLGVLDNKHIPEIYLLGSIEQRMELLKGMMDSDGYAGARSCEYTTISKKLAEDFKILLNSLSIKATIREYDSKFYSKVAGKKYRIHFNTDIDVFRLKRKLENQNRPKRNWYKRRYITGIDKIESEPVQCLMVNSESHLFLAGYGLVPTHNTTLAIEEIKARAVYKPSKIAYIAPTYQQARDIAWSALKRELTDVATYKNEYRLEINTKVLNSEETSLIVLRCWESIESLRGQSFDLLVIDEVAMMRNFQLNWQEVLRPTLTDTRGDVLFISTPKGYNHFYDLYMMENKDSNYKSFRYTSYDNPYISNKEIDNARKDMTIDRFAQEYMAEFKKMEGLVYKEFDRFRHLYDDNDKKPQIVEILCGVDWGYTNPCAVIKLLKDKDNHYWLEKEYYKTKQTTSQIVEIVKSYAPHKVYADPAEPDRMEELKKAGVNVRETNKDIAAGINTVRELFKQNRIKIHKDCIYTIQELETYHYPEEKQDKNQEEKPHKENDHAMDSLRYILHSDTPYVETPWDEDTGQGLYNYDY